MRVALISSEKLPVPPIKGGAVQVLIHAVLPFLAEHHDVTVFSIRDPSLPTVSTSDRIEHVRLPVRPNHRSDYLDALSAALAQREFDLIHVFNRPAFVLPIRKVASASRLILSVHNEMFRPQKLPPAEARACLETVDQVLTISDYIGRTIVKFYPEAAGKLRTVHSGADPETFYPKGSPEAQRLGEEVRRELGMGPGPVVLFVGRLSQKKGLHVVLAAMSRVLDQHPDAQLLIVGSKWYGDDKEDDYVKFVHRLAHPLGHRVYFTGFVPPDDIPRCYAAADVFVCASQWNEPLARVHYEAMAAGLPIVSADCGGNGEVLRENGSGTLIADWRNPDAFALGILTFLDDPQAAAAAGRAGRQAVMVRHNWQRVAADFLQTYADYSLVTTIL